MLLLDDAPGCRLENSEQVGYQSSREKLTSFNSQPLHRKSSLNVVMALNQLEFEAIVGIVFGSTVRYDWLEIILPHVEILFPVGDSLH